MKQLNEHLYFATQIQPQDVPQLRAAGIEQIICHRPDGESPEQPDFADITQAAAAENITALHYPVAGEFPAAMVDGTWQALQGGKTTLMYCRSGTRSCIIWALGEAAHGADAQQLMTQAAAIGYDLSPVKALLESVAR
ncbi:MAG: TIGR01244 family sulfur transferase [Cardiobacteriaceae bacterium]|nr:TIGR01244 family sulfur transferase [Cardiobacteriaceae bacterium]